MLDAVDARRHEFGDRLFTEAVRRHSRALLVGRLDRGRRGLRRPQRREVADRAVDPVTHELDPAVAGACLMTDLLDELLGLDLGAKATQVALRPRHVPARADEARKGGLVMDPACVGR